MCEIVQILGFEPKAWPASSTDGHSGDALEVMGEVLEQAGKS